MPHHLVPLDVVYRWFRCWSADDTWNSRRRGALAV
ncbi:hypothetical protein [Micromonospora sp. CA-111912]